MATIIDSLLVKLGLDSSEFAAGKNKVDKGLKDTGNEAEKAGAKLKKAGKDGAEGFNEVAKSATKFLAIIGGTAVSQVQRWRWMASISSFVNVSLDTKRTESSGLYSWM